MHAHLHSPEGQVLGKVVPFEIEIHVGNRQMAQSCPNNGKGDNVSVVDYELIESGACAGARELCGDEIQNQLRQIPSPHEHYVENPDGKQNEVNALDALELRLIVVRPVIVGHCFQRETGGELEEDPYGFHPFHDISHERGLLFSVFFASKTLRRFPCSEIS